MLQPRNTLLRCLIASIAMAAASGIHAQSANPAPATGQGASPSAAPAPQTSAPATVTPAMAPGTRNVVALSAADKKFMTNAAQGGMAEVQMGQLAAQKASSPEVKQFAEKMVADHTKANDKLKQIAASKGVVLPTDIPSPEKREADKMSKLSGAAFDREYVKHMVADHKKDVTEFRSATKQTRDPDVNQFAKETLPVIEGHLQMVQGLKGVKTASK